MAQAQLDRLELLAETDSLAAELSEWIDRAPAWPPARACQALVRRLLARCDTLRVRLEAPLVVATLGGTGTGKSALVNALVGDEVTPAGRQRPTTRIPTLVCRRGLRPEELAIDAQSVRVVEHDSPALRDLVIIDCPDPDTTEDASAGGTNLARLRELLPYCDVLLVTSSQQKYRSARVFEELADAAPGARLIFVQTHADVDEDIRDDWRRTLSSEYVGGEMFRVDSLSALSDAQAGLAPRGDFGRLVDLLTQSLSKAAATRIRRANFLDLVAAALEACRRRIEGGLPAVAQLETAIEESRGRLAARMVTGWRDQLLGSRRLWEGRLLAEVASRWGLSPFALLLRIYQGLGAIFLSAALWRVRTPVQLAVWGAASGAHSLSRARQSRARAAAGRAMDWYWDEAELRTAAIIVDGYAAEAGYRPAEHHTSAILREASDAGAAFASTAGAQLQKSVERLAARRTGWFARLVYELLFSSLLLVILYRLGRNFFYDSWLAPELRPLLGIDFLLTAGIWIVLWSMFLVWMFTRRLRRGLKREVDAAAEDWASPAAAAGLFQPAEAWCREARRFRDDLERLEQRVEAWRAALATPEPRLGHRVG